MKIKYQDKTLNPNTSPWCLDCDLYKHARLDICITLCGKRVSFRGFNLIDDCEVFEL